MIAENISPTLCGWTIIVTHEFFTALNFTIFFCRKFAADRLSSWMSHYGSLLVVMGISKKSRVLNFAFLFESRRSDANYVLYGIISIQ